MIDFSKEIKKYKPVLEVEQLEEEFADNGMDDMMELLRKLAANQEEANG